MFTISVAILFMSAASSAIIAQPSGAVDCTYNDYEGMWSTLGKASDNSKYH